MLSRRWEAEERPTKRRRGGWRQLRETEAEPVDEKTRGISRLAGGILLQWGGGTVSAPQVASTMQGALSDGLEHPVVRRIAALRGSRHAHGDLMELLGKQTAVLDLFQRIDVARDSSKATHVVFAICVHQGHVPPPSARVCSQARCGSAAAGAVLETLQNENVNRCRFG